MTPAGYSEDHAHVPALIMGNGPSLAKIDFSALQGMATFGMNAAYRYWTQIGWWPDYYSCLDLVVGDSHRNEIASLVDRAEELGIRRFLLRYSLIRAHRALRHSPIVTCYEELLADGVLPKLRDVTTGSHTLLWANRLGYTTILLAGVDCDYTEVVEGAIDRESHLEISTQAPNPNYFFDDYQRPGDRFNRPNLTSDMHVRSWTNAARFLQPATQVVNLNFESRVQVFIKNKNEQDPLTPGILARPSPCAPNAETADADLADLRNTLRRCDRYRGAESLEMLRSYISQALTPSCAPRVAAWRLSHLSLIKVSEALNKYPDGPRPHLTVIVRGIGDVLELNANDHDQTQHTSPWIALSLVAPVGLKPLGVLIRSLHDALGIPPVSIRLLGLLNSLYTPWRRFIPIRVRAFNYAHLRERIRRKRSPH